ncbi:MAG: biotin transporter BioY [Oscillospiraceae bacterium]
MRKSKTRSLVISALLAAFTAVLAQIIIPIGPVPFNLAVLGVYLSGMLLPPLAALGSVAVYVALGAFGVPVFAGFMGGPAILFGKTGGYILGYFFIVLFTSLAKNKSGKLWIIISAMLLGLLCCYVFGTTWFMTITGLDLGKSLVFCVYPFIFPDIVKATFALVLDKALEKRVNFLRS